MGGCSQGHTQRPAPNFSRVGRLRNVGGERATWYTKNAYSVVRELDEQLFNSPLLARLKERASDDTNRYLSVAG